MASSDEEGEIVPDCVTDYHFVDHKDEVVSFSELPLMWSDDIIPASLSTQILYLRGTFDNGLQKIFKKVVSWKFELSYVLPEFYVLSKDKTWIKLQQPRKSYVNTIKATLVTVHCLHFIKRNPGASREDIWNYFLKACSFLEVDPSENDLLVHKPLITEVVKKDKDIAKSEYLTTLLLDMHEENTTVHEDNWKLKKSNFIVDTSPYDSDNGGDNGDESDEDIEFDTVCSFCDNGGDILWCEGRCMRSFHATEEAGADTLCASLGFTDAQVDAMKNFLCKNCQYQRHQCFACGLLGSSNIASGAEVFPCISATCGRFYHSKCVSKLLHPWDGSQADEVEKHIADGDSFLCPVHKCFICKQGEDKNYYELQFAVCRRCPKAYHRKCLPRGIAFEADDRKCIQQRAWDGLLLKRVLIYCMDHKMNLEIGTPDRNHIVFPAVDGKPQHHNGLKQLPPVEKKKVDKSYFSSTRSAERASMQQPLKLNKVEVPVVGGSSSKRIEKGLPVKGSEVRTSNLIMMSRKASYLQPQGTVTRPATAPKTEPYLRNEESVPSLKHKINLSGRTKSMTEAIPVQKKVGTNRSLVEAETKARMMALMQQATASIDEEEFIKNQKLLSGNSCSMSYNVEKKITLGKVEASKKAVDAALDMLKSGCTIEETKAICEPQVLKQIFKWKNDLSFYLAPFLHGMRYTSFGRHFTKVDKLKEIVDRLHWYVQEGDMIVDFCCGSNDFSCFMKEKLQQVGKNCFYKNYDLIQSKNDFNFEKRDWMTVRPDELPVGSQLIMGLNPPFGALGARAYNFIKKALTFKPKLLVLIVPRETRRVDAADSSYDLIWEDDVMLSGKSFYLPGSVDIHNQQLEQWNLQAPPLYLWSRREWTAKHYSIARQHGHIKDVRGADVERKEVEPMVSNYLMEEKRDCFSDYSHVVNEGGISHILDDIPEDSGDVQIPVANDNWCYSRNWNSRSYCDPRNTQEEGNGIWSPIRESLVGDPGTGTYPETDEMCVDMELDSPLNSQ